MASAAAPADKKQYGSVRAMLAATDDTALLPVENPMLVAVGVMLASLLQMPGLIFECFDRLARAKAS